ncbi:hypothetical protein F66182_8891 [Fusarium sp. NRRL 66182]|nr:hypothetical protein F66182_8891 [Fusarium sp. NRRL 66182]
MTNPRVLFFGDLTETDFGVEELVGYAEKSARLRAYFDNALIAAHKTLNELNVQDPDIVSPDSLVKMTSRTQQDESSSVVLRAFSLCFAQIGHLIAQLETNTALRASWAKQEVLIVASCAGQLAGSLAATARSVDDIVKAGPEIVAVMIRAALDADRKTDAVMDDRSKSWAHAVFQVPVSQAVSAADKFNKEKSAAHNKKIYVGAASTWAVTVIGPPSRLDEFFATDPFPGKRVLALPIRTLFHAEHLEKPDIPGVVGDAPILETLNLGKTRFISSSSALLFEPLSLRDLAGEAVLNINSRLTDNTKVFQKVKEIIGNDHAIVTLVVARKGALRLCKALVEDGVSVESID